MWRTPDGIATVGGTAEGEGGGWLGPSSSQGPPMVPAEGRLNFLKLKSSWHRRRQGKILAVILKHWKGRKGRGGWHKASVSICLPLAAPIGLSPRLILTLCGSERVLVVSTEPPDDLSCLTTPGVGGGGYGYGYAEALQPLTLAVLTTTGLVGAVLHGSPSAARQETGEPDTVPQTVSIHSGGGWAHRHGLKSPGRAFLHLHSGRRQPSQPHSLTASHPHTLTPSHPHTRTPSHPHTRTPSHPHTLTPSHPHTLTPSHPHTRTPSHPHTRTPSHPHTLTPAHPHTLTPSHPHTLTP